MIAMGAMSAIRQRHQNATITLLTTAPFAQLAQKSGYFDAVQVDVRPAFYNLAEWIKLYCFFNKSNFLRVYDLQLNDRTKVYYKLFRSKPEWSGVVKGASHRYNNPNWREMHAFKRHQVMLAELGVDVMIPDLRWMNGDVSHLDLQNPYVLFIPGCAPTWPEKRWPANRYAEVASYLVNVGYKVLVLGTESEKDVISQIAATNPNVYNLCGKTSLYDIATLGRKAVGAIGNDTGPTHLISLVGCPTVVLFSGVSHPDLSAPVGDKVSVLREQKISDIQSKDVIDSFNDLIKQ